MTKQDKNRRETIHLLKELVKIESPYFHEDEVMDFAHRWLKEQGVKAEKHHYHERKITDFKGTNILAVVDRGRSGATVCLNGHLDTVQLCHGWSKNPFGEEDGERFYGLGGLDMKGGCAALMMAVARFNREVEIFDGKIILTLVSDEEGPYGLGTNALIEDGMLDGVDLSIITEPTAGFTKKTFPVVCLGARGGFGLTIKVGGVAAHAANPKEGVNAAIEASKLAIAIEEEPLKEDVLLGKGTAAVIGISCDGGACSIPDTAEISLFWHVVRGENQQNIEEYIHKAARRAGIQSSYEIEFREAPSKDSEGFLPYALEEEEEVVQTFAKSVEKIWGDKPTFDYFQSIGDFNYLGTRVNAPAIIFGPDGRNYHHQDEFVEKKSVELTEEIIFQFLCDMLEVKEV